MLYESGGLRVLRLPKQSYSKMGEKTRHGSPGRATLILCECPGSMMGNKSSVISHRGRATPWPYTWVLVCLTLWLRRQEWHDRLYTEKWTLINDWGNVGLQRNAEGVITWNLVTHIAAHCICKKYLIIQLRLCTPSLSININNLCCWHKANMIHLSKIILINTRT